jgi:hypothetical protein
MDRRTSPAQSPPPRDYSTEPGPGSQPCPRAEAAKGPVVNLGESLIRSIRHFWPELNQWLDRVPDTRFLPLVIYHKRFLCWWGISLYLLQLGSRRQLDFDLDARGTQVLDNLNRLAETEQETRPVHDTLDHFLEHTGAAPFAELRTRMLCRLIRMKSLDAARLQGRFVVALDATGHLAFRQPHCPHCLVYRHATHTAYLHQVLEAKLLGPAGLTLSMATEFIENSDSNSALSGEDRKQDCELKALSRLLPQLRQDFPQLRLCLSGDSLYACGRTLQLAKDYSCNYVFTFKPGHMPAVWKDFQALLKLCPENELICSTLEGAHQVHRWVHGLSYRDDQGRTWRFDAIECKETVNSETTTFAWITDLKVDARKVKEIAEKGGRHRWHIENQGFNRQKNSGLNLEHAYSTDPERLKAYYYLLQIAHIILQTFEVGSLLRNMAAEFGRTPIQLFGSLKNLARRLLDAIRYFALSDKAFDGSHAGSTQVRFDTS